MNNPFTDQLTPAHKKDLGQVKYAQFQLRLWYLSILEALVGPDGGEPGEYGPFTKEQVNSKQVKLGEEGSP